MKVSRDTKSNPPLATKIDPPGYGDDSVDFPIQAVVCRMMHRLGIDGRLFYDLLKAILYDSVRGLARLVRGLE